MNKLPKGLDQQGRHPEAAEAATELGHTDDAPETLGTLVLAGAVVVAVVGVIALLAGYFA